MARSTYLFSRSLRSSRFSTAPRAPWRWAALGAAAGLVLALVLFAPACWLAQAVVWGSEGHVALDDARGTVWDGSARLVLAGGAGSRDALALAGRVQWRLRPVLQGLAVALQADCCMAAPWHVMAAPRWGGAQVALTADGPSHWPAALLAALGTPWNTLQPQGDLSFGAEGLTADWHAGRLRLSGRAWVEARDLSSSLSTLKPMGSYRLTLQGGQAPTLRLETIEGALQLSGDGQWVGGRLRFEGAALAAPGQVDALSHLLGLLGRRDGARAIIKLG